MEVGEISSRNPCKFAPLPSYDCTKDGFALAAASPLPVTVENLIFYCKETQYTFGSTPLVCYLDLRNGQNLEWVQKMIKGEEINMNS